MSIVSSFFSSSRPRRSSSSSSSTSFIDVNSIMDTLSSILAGLALRFVIDRIGGNENKLTGTLVGLWEGVVLQHFMTKAKKRSRSSRSRSSSTSRSSSSRSAQPPYEAYLAYCVRLFVDYMLTESLMRVLLIGLWTALGVILADITPSIWADVGMRRFWRRFRRDMYYMTRSLPSISLPWNDNRSYSDSVYSSRPIGTRTTTVRFSPSRAPSEVSVITSTTQPPPLIQSFSSRFVPRSSRRPVPGAFPGDTISEAGTEVTATPSSTSIGLRSPSSDISTESGGGGLFGSAFNAFSLLTGRPRRLSSYPDTANGADDDNQSTASTVTHSVGTSLHNPAEIPDEDDSDTETERERAALKKAKGKGKAKAFVEDVGDESTPTRPDIVLPTPSESTILQHPSHLPLASTTANPDYLHTGLTPDELPPPSAEMPMIPNNYGDDEWENISRGDAGSSEEVRVVPPPPGQAVTHDRIPTDSSFENVDHEDAAQDELEYQDEQTPLPVKRPELTFTYQVAPIPLPPVDTSITTPPPMDAPYEHEEDDLGDLHESQQAGNTSEFGEMRQPLGQMLGLGRGKKKNGSVLDYDFSGSPWNPKSPQQAPATTLGGSLGGSTFTGAGIVPPPAPAPEFFTQPEGTVPEPEVYESDRPPTYHSRRNSAISLGGFAKSASEAGIGAKPVPGPTPPPTASTPAPAANTPAANAPAAATVPPVSGSAVGSRRNSRQPSREPSLEKLNNKAQTEVGTGAKGSKKGSREASREPSVEPTNRKAATEVGTSGTLPTGPAGRKKKNSVDALFQQDEKEKEKAASDIGGGSIWDRKGGKNSKPQTPAAAENTAASLFGNSGNTGFSFGAGNTGGGNKFSLNSGWGEDFGGGNNNPFSSGGNAGGGFDDLDFNTGDGGDAWNGGGNTGAGGDLLGDFNDDENFDQGDQGLEVDNQADEPLPEPQTPEVALEPLPGVPTKRVEAVLQHKRDILKNLDKIPALEKELSDAITPETKAEVGSKLLQEKGNIKGMRKLERWWLSETFPNATSSDLDVSADGAAALKIIKDALSVALLEDRPSLKVKFAPINKTGGTQKSTTVSFLNKAGLKHNMEGPRDCVIQLPNVGASSS